MPEGVVIAFAAGLGAAIGSFLNVCVYRLPRNQSVLHPPSTCPGCGQRIPWYDNVPVLGWLRLRGRCRRCRAPISVEYPLVEALVAALWGAAAWAYGPSWTALTAAVFGTLLLGIALTDARHYLIPDEFTWGGLALGLALRIPGGWSGLAQGLIGAAAGFALLYGIAWAGEKVFRKEAMGGGDIKMMAMVGAFVGWQGVLLTVFGGALLGTLVFVPISLRTKKLVPFGVFLAAGAAVAFVAGDVIIAWYKTQILGF
ncbi:MAG: A24 family peptidase [Gemmatimonadota bacterium]|nr:A24 family peptidase [Gemmatimonadota bacterium]